MIGELKNIITFKTDIVKSKEILNFLVRGSFLCDLFGCIYLIFIYLPRRLPELVKLSLSFQGINISAMEPDLVNQMSTIATGNMKTLVTLFFILHIIVYYFTLKNKKWAIKYIKGFSITGFIFGLLMITETFQDGFIWFFINLIMAFIYFFVFWWSRYYLKSQAQ